MADQWYYAQRGNRSGPVSSAELKQLAESGRLTPEDMIWNDGMSNWMRAGSLQGLFLPKGGQEDLPEKADGVSVVARRFLYKMVQMPPNIQIDEGTSTEGKAAAYLQEMVNLYSAQGWEFYRVDEIGIHIRPGCLGAFLGQRSERIGYYVVTFRKQV